MEFKLFDLAICAFAFRNDLHLLHLNISGIDFKDTHEWLGELYNKALNDFDWAIENAILTKEIDFAPNLTTVFSNSNNWKYWSPLEGNIYTVENALSSLKKQWKDYKEALNLVREFYDKKGNNAITSDIDSIVSFWSMEIDYKVERTLK